MYFDFEVNAPLVLEIAMDNHFGACSYGIQKNDLKIWLFACNTVHSPSVVKPATLLSRPPG